jgi:molybdopterin synthase catalytic subunit
MTVRVLMFARAADLAGARRVVVDVADGATVANLRQRIESAWPRLAPLLPRCAVALGNEVVRDDQVLSADCEVALLPPVSGG